MALLDFCACPNGVWYKVPRYGDLNVSRAKELKHKGSKISFYSTRYSIAMRFSADFSSRKKGCGCVL